VLEADGVISVLVVDDSVVIRRLITDSLVCDPKIRVVGTASNGRVAIAKVEQLRPDIVTLDVEMPVMDGLETLRALRPRYPRLPIIMFSTLTAAGATATLDALAAGATDYVTKPANVGSIRESILSVREQLIPRIHALCGPRGRQGPLRQPLRPAFERSGPIGRPGPGGGNAGGGGAGGGNAGGGAGGGNAGGTGGGAGAGGSGGAAPRLLGNPHGHWALSGSTPQAASGPTGAGSHGAGSHGAGSNSAGSNSAGSNSAGSNGAGHGAAGARQHGGAGAEPKAKPVRIHSDRVDIIAIGCSTGGPDALSKILRALPANLPVPIVVVQHMPPVFTKMFAERLDKTCAMTVVEAADNMMISQGTVYIAPGDLHLEVARRGQEVVTKTQSGPPENFCRPAADALFRSVSSVYGKSALAVVLTGMGQDGRRGCEVLHLAGAEIVAQDEATSVVWGMPGAVTNAGLADSVLPLGNVASHLISRMTGGRRTSAVEVTR
jgi:two-component system, chemotaxis family, protein-glutamate methylesterase/glutaminase